MKTETHAVLAEDLLERSRTGLAVALKGDLPMEEQAHGAQVAIAMATAAQVHATLATMPAEVVAVNEALAKSREDLEVTRQTVACMLREALTDSDPKIREVASNIADELGREGQPIWPEVNRNAEAVGVGPNLFTFQNVRYWLRRQYFDAKGKRWEHTGGWTDRGVPVMRRENKPERTLTLAELVEMRGPLLLPESPNWANCTPGWGSPRPY